MRLYCPPGLSSRVVQALRTRLGRTLRMADEEGRARSRSRGREADESGTPSMPEGTMGMPEGTPGMPEGAPGMPEGTPGMTEGNPDDVTASLPPAPSVVNVAEVLAVSTELAKRISECATKIGNVTENLAIALDDFNQGRMELHKGFQELSEQIKSTAHCITTMTSGVSFQSGEITKLLKAFDRWAATGRTVETNIQGAQGEVETQAKKLEASLKSGFENIGGHLQQMVRLLREQAPSVAVLTAAPGVIPEGTGDAGTPLTTPAVGTTGSWYSGSWCSGSWCSSGWCSWNHWRYWIHQFRRIAIARYRIHKLRGIAIAWIGSWCSCHNGFATSSVASVTLHGFLSGTAEWAETKYSPSDPNTVPACGHRYQRCGDGGTEDIVTDGISS